MRPEVIGCDGTAEDNSTLAAALQILIHEPTSLWTAELERTFAFRRDLQFRWRPYSADLLEDLAQAELLVLVGEADKATLRRLLQVKERREQMPVVCLIRDLLPDWEWAARESGAEVVLDDVVERHRAAAALERLLPASGSKDFENPIDRIPGISA